MSDNFIDLTIGSPPYDTLRTYTGMEWNETVWRPTIKELYRVTKVGGVVAWIVNDAVINGSKSGTSYRQANWAMECGFNFHDDMIWQKPNYAPLFPTVKRYDHNFEYMFIWSKGQPKTWNPIKDKPKAESSKQRGKYKTSFINQDGSRTYKDSTANNSDYSKRTKIWLIPNGQKRGIGHPAPFPEALVHDHLITWTNEGDLVYDPFMGSGTTARVCIGLNRNWVGSEISAKYCEIIERRILESNE